MPSSIPSVRPMHSEQPRGNIMVMLLVTLLKFQMEVNSENCMVAERCSEKWPQTVNRVILLMTVMLGGVRDRDQMRAP